MPICQKKLIGLSIRAIAFAGVVAGVITVPIRADDVPATQPALPGLSADSFYGKEPTEGVYVRDSASAVEKLALAQKMERLKEWNKSADLYQEVIVKYADRVVPSQLDKDKKIYQYTSITPPVQERLARWPQEGLDAYRARFETPAQAMLDHALPDDVATLNRVYSIYFVTEAGKQAGIRLVDLYLENGEYPAAAWVGDRLLGLHPGLVAERSAVLYRTALAYYYGGEPQKAKDRLAQLKGQFGNDRGIVRGKDVVLAESLAEEIQAPVGTSQYGSADSWPVAWGDYSRGRISTAEGRPGSWLYGIPLSKPNWGPANQANHDALQTQYDVAVRQGMTLGIMPVTDRGELYFQDGQRIYAVGLENGVPLPGWSQTYPNGAYTLSGVIGTPRGHQLTLTLTEHEVLGVMGLPDHLSPQLPGMAQAPDARLVCLDRQFGREKWTITLSQLPDEAKESRTLQMSGSPVVIGDSVLIMARGAKTQFEDCYVLSFDLATGKFRWSTYVASAGGAMAWAMNGMPAPQGESTSHLAYSNGRVYVQTNLGALAALDAYTGAVVWLDIYPTGRQTDMPQRFNRLIDPSQMQSTIHRPWTFNPVIVQEGHVFTLPTEGHNLLIYDAANGVEIKRIDLRDMEQKDDRLAGIDTMVSVSGEKLLLAGEKGLIYLNWKNYERRAFDGDRDNITIWKTGFPRDGNSEDNPSIRGRAFVAKDLIFVACEDRLYCLTLVNGKMLFGYPIRPASGNGGKWEAPDEPGNVLVTEDHVIIAGARFVNVYTDLDRAKAKLTRKLAAAPLDPRPRLRFAEILFVAREIDAALARLDEAAALMGGIQSLQAGANRDGLFNDALNFADKLWHAGGDENREAILKLYDRAASAALSPVQHVHYRLSRGKYEESRNDYVAAIRLYEQILADRRMRPVPMGDEASVAPLQADTVAERAIAAIIRTHPAAYDSFEQTAAAELEIARADKENPAAKLLELARTYPNSSVAAKAMMAAAEAFEGAGDPRHAIRVLRDMWFKYPDSPDKAGMQESIARNYLALAAVPRTAPGTKARSATWKPPPPPWRESPRPAIPSFSVRSNCAMAPSWTPER